MSEIRLSDYFSGWCWKRLSAVETDPEISNQHEFNGVARLVQLFGRDRRENFPSLFVYLSDTAADTISCDGRLTWYDARERNPFRTEYRLYYQDNPVMDAASEGDLLVVALTRTGNILVIVAREGSVSERQIAWLFGLEPTPRFRVARPESRPPVPGFAARHILALIGIDTEPERHPDALVHLLVDRFGNDFPTTRAFSAFARETLGNAVDPQADPDGCLVKWIDHEETLFRLFERHLFERRLEKRFEDIEDFIGFAKSILQRRKSRAGFALENHLEEIFRVNGISYSRCRITENKSKPDFVLPGIEYYRNPAFPPDLLTVVGAKYSCKDRWRQVLSEAARVRQKHLVTLEPAITEAQTAEMRDSGVQLVVPHPLHSTYSPAQRKWLMDVKDLLGLAAERQDAAKRVTR